MYAEPVAAQISRLGFLSAFFLLFWNLALLFIICSKTYGLVYYLGNMPIIYIIVLMSLNFFLLFCIKMAYYLGTPIDFIGAIG